LPKHAEGLSQRALVGVFKARLERAQLNIDERPGHLVEMLGDEDIAEPSPNLASCLILESSSPVVSSF